MSVVEGGAGSDSEVEYDAKDAFGLSSLAAETGAAEQKAKKANALVSVKPSAPDVILDVRRHPMLAILQH